MHTNPRIEQETKAGEQQEQRRRELVQKMGKFALYAAPFTVLAVANKATAATGVHSTGPGKHH